MLFRFCPIAQVYQLSIPAAQQNLRLKTDLQLDMLSYLAFMYALRTFPERGSSGSHDSTIYDLSRWPNFYVSGNNVETILSSSG
ncbi:hypothetical protein KL942_003778 [Ogataea angusta]|uniref:Uncharacterized protein n=1 Tax=Pichia angusta TaxID=870730 RepID=A0ABQ7RVS3_PICAN|nr:hypothetical protein KL942_003778 [Ogataea angusta]KAG7848611.1 hypothetical protein KL940_003466 [Ogataea angusta]